MFRDLDARYLPRALKPCPVGRFVSASSGGNLCVWVALCVCAFSFIICSTSPGNPNLDSIAERDCSIYNVHHRFIEALRMGGADLPKSNFEGNGF